MPISHSTSVFFLAYPMSGKSILNTFLEERGFGGSGFSWCEVFSRWRERSSSAIWLLMFSMFFMIESRSVWLAVTIGVFLSSGIPLSLSSFCLERYRGGFSSILGMVFLEWIYSS